MPHVTVTCRCLRPLRQELGRPAGFLVCGCGNRVRINMDRSRICSAHTEDGAPCRADLYVFDPVPLCRPHRDALLIDPVFTGDTYTKAHIDEIKTKARDEVFRVKWGNVLERDERYEAEIRARQERDDHAVVYYIAIRSHIKIGFTGNMRMRMTDLVPDAVLATEPGAQKLEARRHAQFDHLRGTFGREYFQVHPELIAHIEDVLAKHGAPAITTYPRYDEWRTTNAST